jgi:hypothetical protein
VKAMYKINTESIGDVKKYVYYYRKESKEYGPFTYEDILGFVQKGEIGPDDYIFKFGNRKFIKASEMKGLFDVKLQPQEKQEEQENSSTHEAEASEVITVDDADEERKKEVRDEEKRQGDAKAEPVDNYHITFDNMPMSASGRNKKNTAGTKIPYIVIGIIVIALISWAILRFL